MRKGPGVPTLDRNFKADTPLQLADDLARQPLFACSDQELPRAGNMS